MSAPENTFGRVSVAPAVNPWLIAIAVMSGTFMEVLDTTIVNVSIPHMAGTLSASNEEATWVLTSYLVSNAIILPMTGWLANYFGRKRLLMASVVGFTASSFLCGLAPSLPLLILFRVLQGATGGGLQPLSQAILLESFPPRERGMAMGFWGLGIVVAPMLGPVVGGWLTDNYSWRWVFYVNVPVGLFAITMIQLFVFDPPYIKRRAGRIDFWGMGMLVVGIGALQILLDKGQQDDWFSSRFIATLAILSAVALVALIVRELLVDHPIVDLRIFKDRTYATGVFLITILGFVLFGSIVLLPLFMQTLLGYSAFDAGLANLPRGAASFVMMPLVGFLMTRIAPRRLLVTGLVLASTSLYLLSRLNLDAGYWNFFLPLVLQGAALGLLFIPLTTITNGFVPKERMGNATSLFNLMRNIGGSVGIAIVTTVLARNNQGHIQALGARIDAYDPATQHRIAELKGMLMARGLDAAAATRGALAMIWGEVQRQAAALSYGDAFRMLAILFFSMLVLVPLMKTSPNAGGPIGMHGTPRQP
jgi:MFS transporter, DHA2 family, multidrug resistance protein